MDIKLTQKEVLFGYHDDMYDVKLVNTFISIGKLSIGKYRYGKYPHLISVLHLEIEIFCKTYFLCVCICVRFILLVYVIVI